MAWDTKDCMTVIDMLNHPWVQGEMARTKKIKRWPEPKRFKDMMKNYPSMPNSRVSSKASFFRTSLAGPMRPREGERSLS
eukprot:scaffold693924_cov67-Attheya_sp.AAC.1